MLLETILNSGTYGLLELVFGLATALIGAAVVWFALSRRRLLGISAFPSALTVLLTAMGAFWFNWDIVNYLTLRAVPEHRQSLIAAHISVGFGMACVIGLTIAAYGLFVLVAVHVSPDQSDEDPVDTLPLVAGGVLASVLLGVFGAWFAAAVTLLATLTLLRLRSLSPEASWMGAVAVAAIGMGLGGVHNAMDMAIGFRAVAEASVEMKAVIMANHVAGLTGVWASVAGVVAIVPAAVILARRGLKMGIIGSGLAILVMAGATILVEASVTTPMVRMMSSFAPDGRLIAEVDDQLLLPRVSDAARPPVDVLRVRALRSDLLVSEGQYGVGFSLRDWTANGSTVAEQHLDFGVMPSLSTAIVDEAVHLERRGVEGVPVVVWADAASPWSLLGPVVTTVSRVPETSIHVAVVVAESHQGVVTLVTTTQPATQPFSTSPTTNAVLLPDPSTTLDELVQALSIAGVRVSVPAETMPAVEPEGTEAD